MRLIHVTYRAVFTQLKSSSFRMNGPVNVEVIERYNQWVCQSPDTGVEFNFTKMPSAESARKECESRFERMMSDGWWIFGREPRPAGQKGPREDGPRLLNPQEIQMKDGQVYFLEVNDFTHIFDPKNPNRPTDDKDKSAQAACGQYPRIRNFISLKANVEPTCKACAEIYRAR
jgi:hypothetical protein